ncbi:MAG: hypothetical protein KDA24_11065 [Deltaproteobacteria bacterium]|nr:hypothetical protein [Deltaproteobacteria bacterium]
MRTLAALVLISLVGCSATANEGSDPTEETFELGPIDTYLRTSPDDVTPAPPLIVDLSSREIAAGDVLTLSVEGRYHDDASLDTSDYSIAVFSASDEVLDSTNPHRVPGAIEAGEAYATDPTYLGDLPTDIPEDFRLDGDGDEGVFEVVVEVPPGGTFLIVGLGDKHYVDNTASDEGFRVNLTY